MFLVLALLAFCLFAPTVLCPLLRQYGELLAEETRLVQAVGHLEDDLEHRAAPSAGGRAPTSRLNVLAIHLVPPGRIPV